MSAAVVFGLGAASPAAAQTLTYLTSPVNGHQYALTPALTWTEAEALAVSEGGHLATVRSQTENDWLQMTFNTNAWIGFTDEASEGVWIWASGESPGYTNWNPSEPNNLGNEDYAAMIGGGLGTWNDGRGDVIWSGIIELVTDCNGNGVPDLDDINSGTSSDCNGNLIPDSCDFAANTSLDCDANGIPDECDIASGAADCNADGIPDACQITDDASLDLNANGVLDSCESIGTSYCSPAIANSTGAPAAILALGSEVAASNDLTMTVSGLPLNTFAMFVTSQTQGYAFPVPGSQGALCVTGFPGRFNLPGQIQSSGSSGSLVFPVDLTSLPTPIGFTAAQPGDTWNFQAWYRDANPTVTSNFTDAVGITFQ